MKIWFVPSWNGDLRLEADGDTTVLTIEKPTPAEVEVLGKMKTAFLEQGWVDEKKWQDPSRWRKRKCIINAKLADVGPVASKIMRPGEAVLTAITLADGKMVTHSGSDSEELKDIAAEAEKKGASSAVTVKRPTPSCPECFPGAIEPATEVLLSFLSPEQHESWAKDRTMLVHGGLTGTPYVLAHRHSDFARQVGRVCYDVDAQIAVHFHDRSVPPEEEVLAAKLILEHREPWLRNEATMLGYDPMSGGIVDTLGGRGAPVFKNPFGDITDGVLDSFLTVGVGIGHAIGKALSRH